MPKPLTITELSEKYDVPELSELIRWDHAWRDWRALVRCTLCGKERWLTTQAIGKKTVCVCRRGEKIAEAFAKKTPEQKRRVPLTEEQKVRMHERCKAATKAKYGVEYPAQIPEIMQRIKDKTAETNKVRYGDACSMRNPNVKAKARATCQARYGYDNASQCPEVLEKMLKTKAAEDHANQFRSAAEMEIEEFVRSLGLETTHRASGDREIDIFVPSKGIGIEHNGLFWHCEKKGRDHGYHLSKKRKAEAEGIDLIQIWSDLWLARKAQVKNFLRAKLGCCKNRIGMRKCTIAQVPQEQARLFTEAHHIQGAPAQITRALGAYVDGCLTAIATFAPHHRGHRNSDGTVQMVLNRVCTKDDWVVSGFLGKAVRWASKEFQSPIVSWVDLMWSNGKSYLAAGFTLDGTLAPDYCYTKGPRRISKQSFRKIDERTESQRAADEGLWKLWDCGKLRFVFSKC